MPYFIKLLLVSLLTTLAFFILRPWVFLKTNLKGVIKLMIMGFVILFSLLSYYSILVNKITLIDNLFSNEIKGNASYLKLFRTDPTLKNFEDIAFSLDTVLENCEGCSLTLMFWSSLSTEDREQLNSQDYSIQLESICSSNSVVDFLHVDTLIINYGLENKSQTVTQNLALTNRYKKQMNAAGKMIFNSAQIPNDINVLKLSFNVRPVIPNISSDSLVPVSVIMYKYIDSTRRK